MKIMNTILAAAALTALPLASANAMPISANPSVTAPITLVAGGCGPGAWRDSAPTLRSPVAYPPPPPSRRRLLQSRRLFGPCRINRDDAADRPSNGTVGSMVPSATLPRRILIAGFELTRRASQILRERPGAPKRNPGPHSRTSSLV